MRTISNVVEIPSGSTINQMETALNNKLNNGWVFGFIFPLGTKTYIVFTKTSAV